MFIFLPSRIGRSGFACFPACKESWGSCAPPLLPRERRSSSDTVGTPISLVRSCFECPPAAIAVFGAVVVRLGSKHKTERERRPTMLAIKCEHSVELVLFVLVLLSQRGITYRACHCDAVVSPLGSNNPDAAH